MGKLHWILFGDNTAPQLELRIPNNREYIENQELLSKNYLLRTYQDGDYNNVLKLYKSSGLNITDIAKLNNAMYLCVPQGIFVCLHKDSNELVGAFMARHISDELHNCGGRIDWLAVLPEHRTHGIGQALTVAATKRLKEIGYQHIYVTTDDSRLGAIKTFIKAGFVPIIDSENMYQRWEIIFLELQISFDEDMHIISSENWKR